MRGSIDVMSDAPTVWVGVALRAERVIRGEEGPMHLARNDASKAKQATHPYGASKFLELSRTFEYD